MPVANPRQNIRSQCTTGGRSRYMPDALPALFPHEQHCFSDNIQNGVDGQQFELPKSAVLMLKNEELGQSILNAELEWFGIFCSPMSTFRLCLLLPPDVQQPPSLSKVIGSYHRCKDMEGQDSGGSFFCILLLLKTDTPIAFLSKEKVTSP